MSSHGASSVLTGIVCLFLVSRALAFDPSAVQVDARDVLLRDPIAYQDRVLARVATIFVEFRR